MSDPSFQDWKAAILEIEGVRGRSVDTRRAFNEALAAGGKTGFDIVSNVLREKNDEKRIRVFKQQYVPFMLTILKKSDAELRAYIAESARKYGIRPATQIFYRGAFGTEALQHHGVFLGSGLVCEVGGKWCKTNASKTGFLDQCLSVVTLEDFVIRGNGNIFAIEYDHIDLDDMEVLRTQLTRALTMTDKADWNYNPFTNNCQHWSSYVTTGEAIINQCDLRMKKFKEVKVEFPKSKTCENSSCSVVHRTVRGEVCASDPKSSIRGDGATQTKKARRGTAWDPNNRSSAAATRESRRRSYLV